MWCAENCSLVIRFHLTPIITDGKFYYQAIEIVTCDFKDPPPLCVRVTIIKWSKSTSCFEDLDIGYLTNTLYSFKRNLI